MKDYLKQFNTTAEYNTYINGTPDLPNVSLTLDDNEVHYNKYVDYSREYLTFEALESGTFTLTIPSQIDANYLTSVSYSTDNGVNWTTTTIDNTNQTITTPTIAQGEKVLWKGIGNTMALGHYQGNVSVSSTTTFNVMGNIMSLLYGDNFIGQTSFASGSKNNFTNLFKDTNKIISVENLVLPATTLTEKCYYQMFSGCTSLTTTPELPATTLAQECYRYMFQNCTSLTTTPELPATTLAKSCYNGIFQNCNRITSAPVLPATTLADSCYTSMFSGCRLTTAPVLPATTLTQYCYSQMFFNCTSLTTAPVLPATTLTSNCYDQMFSGCSNLNSIKMLATNISASYCLNNWVNGVAATGTFTKAAEMTTLPTGNNGIPSGWTVIDA